MIAWTGVIGILVFSLASTRQIISSLTPYIAVLSIWILGDGVMLANDLNAAVSRIKELEMRLKTTTETYDKGMAELIKLSRDNHQLFLELHTRVTQINSNLKRKTNSTPSSASM
jgi:hypothetical protein